MRTAYAVGISLYNGVIAGMMLALWLLQRMSPDPSDFRAHVRVGMIADFMIFPSIAVILAYLLWANGRKVVH